jgi:predicted unusual protein kinase regulating ubiquinone biosynthesis (AarF/ABC1/UbiB family)
MEKLDIGLADYLSYYKNNIKESVSILLQIIDIIYILQNTIKFMHRDFHIRNIMLRKNKSKKNYTLIDGTIIKNQDYSVVFIDFGMCCAEIQSKNYCISGVYECKDKKCNLNFSTDLRLLFSSLCESDINPNLKKVINSIFLKPEYIKMEKSTEKIFKHKFHYYYDDKTVSQDFIPQNLMKQLLISLDC